MKTLPITLGSLLLLAAVALSGCGDQSSGLSSSEVAYLRAKRYQELYGTAATATTTVSSVVTITSVTTATTTVY